VPDGVYEEGQGGVDVYLEDWSVLENSHISPVAVL